MSTKKYQVFISSTYIDLVEERRAVEQAIIESGDFPVGMEAFPAADEDQFELIKSIIAQCDYYVLIIAGRYGSLASDGKSYTEKEYDYAVEIGVPVLVMLRENREALPANFTEADPEIREKLENFVTAATSARVRKGWSSADSLKLAVYTALTRAKATKQRPGWIRGDQSASSETLEKLVALQEENEQLRKALAAATPQAFAPKNIADLDMPLVLEGKYKSVAKGSYARKGYTFRLETTLGEVFELLAPHLMEPKFDSSVAPIIAKRVWQRHNGEVGDSFTTNDEIYQTIKLQLMALKLVKVQNLPLQSGGSGLCWSLSDLGMREMLRRRVITSETGEPTDENPSYKATEPNDD